jgi:DNA-binding HxlR family transcriptional regulator
MATKNQVKYCNSECDFERAIILLADVWILRIVNELHKGQKRHNELLDNIDGLSKSILSTKLKILLQSDLIINQIRKTMPPYSIYKLSPKGQKVVEIISAYRSFGQNYLLKK